MTSEPTYVFPLWALVVTLALAIVLFMYSLGLRLAHVLHDRNLARLRQIWWPVIAQVTMLECIDDSFDLGALKTGSRKKLLREWCRFRKLITGSGCENLEQIADRLDLLRHGRRLLRRRSVGDKLLAVQALGYLRDSKSWADIHALLRLQDVTLSITAATALVHINAHAAVDEIIPMIKERPTWPRTQVGRILNIAGPQLVTAPLCREISTADARSACCLLQFYESAHVEAIDSLAAELLLTRSQPELLAASLKAVRGHLPTELIENLAAHNAWFVRMQAANLLGRLGTRKDYRVLEPLLGDPEWWVRYRAAQAITRLPFLGSHASQKLANRQRDRYARDIMRQALAEAGMA